MISKKRQAAKISKVTSLERKSSRKTSSMSFYDYLQALIAKHPEWAQQGEGVIDPVGAYALRLMRAIKSGIEPPRSLHELLGLEYEHWKDTVLWSAEKLYFQYVYGELEANPHIFENFRESVLRSIRKTKRQRRTGPARMR
jgi:hypothetical protein